MSDLELKPCPFCGGEAEMMGALYPYVECSECHVNFSCDHSYDFDFEDAAEKWNNRIQSEVERLQGRVVELEDFVADAQKEAWRALDPDYVPPDVESAMKALLHKAAVITGEVDPDDIEPSPWLLRKQAEAIDRSLSYRPLLITVTGRNCIEVSDLKRYAQTLRQQADELEQSK